jgi:predicted TPR repeat methyltransferase
MRSRPRAFDAILSADTLVYFGALEAPLAAASLALRPGGTLIFTLESRAATRAESGTRAVGTIDSPTPDDTSSGFTLEPHGRYTHTEPYIRATLERAGFRIQGLNTETLREERGNPVKGFLVIATT